MVTTKKRVFERDDSHRAIRSADLQFKDNSNFKVGSNSSVHLDKFIYDPNNSTGAIAIQATRGTFRFVAGSQGSGDRPDPYNTLGVRG
jgi:hypothetical protein